MDTWLAVLIYLAAIAIPAFLLYHFGCTAWYWHLLAVVASLVLGLAPVPVTLQTRGFDLCLGFAFLSLISWGLGGLLLHQTHHHRHA